MKTIYIVEDDDNLCMLVSMTLSIKKPAWKVKTFEGAREALDFMKTSAPDLVMTDIMMPDMDGFALMEEIRKIPSCQKTPVVALSAVGDLAYKKRAMELGAADYWIKPLMGDMIVGGIEKILGKD